MARLSKEEVKKYYEETKAKAEECGYCGNCDNCADHILATEFYIWEVDGGGPMFNPGYRSSSSKDGEQNE